MSARWAATAATELLVQASGPSADGDESGAERAISDSVVNMMQATLDTLNAVGDSLTYVQAGLIQRAVFCWARIVPLITTPNLPLELRTVNKAFGHAMTELQNLRQVVQYTFSQFGGPGDQVPDDYTQPSFKTALAAALQPGGHALHFKVFDDFCIAYLVSDTLRGMSAYIDRHMTRWSDALHDDGAKLMADCPPWLEHSSQLADRPPPAIVTKLVQNEVYEAGVCVLLLLLLLLLIL
eukprot:362584-Pyramimonas_sp.AAC.1